MSTFTMSLKEVLDQLHISTSINDAGIRSISNYDAIKIGLGTYTIFDPSYRPTINGKILDHYWNREIGAETIDMFMLFTRRKMNEIMPYYNQLYNSERLTFDPLKTVDISTIGGGTQHQTDSTSSHVTADATNSAESRTVNLTTPQTALSGSEDYASGAVDANSKGTGNNTSDTTAANTTDNTSSSNSSTSGYQGITSQLLQAYRTTFLNIDMMVINELEDLFMSVWDNGDSYSWGFDF